jgi:hypothetical protein
MKYTFVAGNFRLSGTKITFVANGVRAAGRELPLWQAMPEFPGRAFRRGDFI